MEVEKEETKKKRSFLFKLGKVIAWIVGSVIFLFILILLLIQTSFVQNFARKKIVSYLDHKLKTKVEIGKLDIKFPTTVSLQNVFFEDQSKDTLLYGGEINVNISMLRLLKNEVQIKEISLDHIVAKVKRLPPDSVFNFQFIVDAFSSDQKKVSKNEDTSTLKMSINRILIDNTRIIYKDAYSGNDMDLAFGHFDTKISTFDPSHLLFDIPSITIKGLSGHFYQMQPLQKPVQNTIAEKSAEPGNYLQLLNKEINLSDINVAYKSEPSHLNTSFIIGDAQLHPKTIDLKNSIINLKDAALNNSNIVIQTNTNGLEKKPKETIASDTLSASMKIIAGEITIKNSNLKYDDQAAPHTPSGMDYSHLELQQLSLLADNIQYSSDTILASVKSASMKEKSGFVLNNLTTDFYMIPNGVFLYNLLIQTPGSEIRNRAYITYSSLNAIKKNVGELGIYLDLQKSKINVKDLWTFVPKLKKQTASLPSNSTFYIDAKITGKVNDLNFQKLRLRGLTATDINVTGIIKGLPDPKKINADLTIINFQSSQKDILSFIPKNALPPNITLPQTFAASGKIKGGINNLYTGLNINTTLGNAKLDGSLVNITDKKKAQYDMVLQAKNLQVGTFIQNPKLGSLTGIFKVKGKGYNPETANASFDGTISEISLNNYTYHDIKTEGTIANKNYKLNASVHDPNLDVTLAANGIFSGKYPTLHLKATIDSINTLPLHFTSTTLKYHGQIDGDFTNINPDSLAGRLLVTHSILVNNGKRVTLDSAEINADNTLGNHVLSAKTDFFSASLKGKFKLTQLANVFKQSIDPYFSLTDKKDTAHVDPYHFSINASIIDNPALRTFLPDISQLKPIKFSGNFSSDSGWNASLSSPHILYGSSVIDSLNFTAGTKDSVLAFKTSLRHFKSGKSLNIYASALDGTLKHNQLDFTLNMKDQDSKNKYRLSGTLLHPSLKDYVFSLKPGDLLLNADKWIVNADNKIEYSNGGIHAKNFILNRNGQQFGINSKGDGENEPLEIDFKDFKIATLTGFIQNDSLMVNGLLNGQAIVKNVQTKPTFTTDLSVTDLSIYNDTIGNLNAKINNEVANTYHANITLKGFGNDVNINGDYFVKPQNSSYNLTVDVTSFQMKALEGFTKGGIKNASGNLYGKIALNGSLDNPNINGKIQFNNTSLNVSTLNNVFKIDKEAIAIINNKGIEFNKFSIHDAANNAITIDGSANTTDFQNYIFDLKINARNFQAINSTSKDNKVFYGKMVFSTRLTVKGTPEHPIVDGDITINDKTNFTVVLPQEEPGVEKREGIVRFVDMSATAEDSLFMVPFDSLKTSSFKGYDISLNINVDKDAIFNLIVDQANGDFLKLKGTGQLTAGVDASGKITLVGSYEIDDGSYDLSFNFIKRKFKIQKGSRIVWTGEPTTAQIDVTAIYISNTAPLDLVQDQIGDIADKNIYKQKLPFEVHLLLQGQLLKPQISFDIILPDDKNYNVSKDIISTVQNKLIQLRQEQGEMNKQVFALLLLNRFVGENPFDNSSGGSLDANTFARQSVSRLLTEQLNQLAAGLIQGVDVNFDVANTEDYTTGSKQNRTDLKVGISKNLLSDRLSVSVGSDFELDGPMQQNQQQNNIAGNIAINYKLSKDGKYMLRAYRKNDYTGAIEGYVVETGLGFIISVDYNKFKQIFLSKKQRRRKREINKENKEDNKKGNAINEDEKKIAPLSQNNENEK